MNPLIPNLPFAGELDLLYPIYGHYISWPAYRLYGGHLALDSSALETLAIHCVTEQHRLVLQPILVLLLNIASSSLYCRPFSYASCLRTLLRTFLRICLDLTRHSLNRHQVTPQFLFGHTQSHKIPRCSLIHGEIRTAQSDIPRSFDPSPTLHLSQPHDAQPLSDSHGIPASPMAPPSKPRKRKAPTLRVDVWEPYKARIIELHIEQKLPLRKVKETIREEFSFTVKCVFPLKGGQDKSLVLADLLFKGYGSTERA